MISIVDQIQDLSKSWWNTANSRAVRGRVATREATLERYRKAMMGKPLTKREIAQLCGIPKKTVEDHVANILLPGKFVTKTHIVRPNGGITALFTWVAGK